MPTAARTHASRNHVKLCAEEPFAPAVITATTESAYWLLRAPTVCRTKTRPTSTAAAGLVAHAARSAWRAPATTTATASTASATRARARPLAFRASTTTTAAPALPVAARTFASETATRAQLLAPTGAHTPGGARATGGQMRNQNPYT